MDLSRSFNDTMDPGRDYSEDALMNFDFDTGFREKVTLKVKARRELQRKLRDSKNAQECTRWRESFGCCCKHVNGFTEATGRVLHKALKPVFKQSCPDMPERFSPYVIAMATAGRLIPAPKPSAYPEELRKVKAKGTKSAPEGHEKDATWVASHLCHNRRCVNAEHLVWEPSWMNRLRDNCTGADACVHRRDKSLAPHGATEEELIDWPGRSAACLSNS